MDINNIKRLIKHHQDKLEIKVINLMFNSKRI